MFFGCSLNCYLKKKIVDSQNADKRRNCDIVENKNRYIKSTRSGLRRENKSPKNIDLPLSRRHIWLGMWPEWVRDKYYRCSGIGRVGSVTTSVFTVFWDQCIKGELSLLLIENKINHFFFIRRKVFFCGQIGSALTAFIVFSMEIFTNYLSVKKGNDQERDFQFLAIAVRFNGNILIAD